MHSLILLKPFQMSPLLFSLPMYINDIEGEKKMLRALIWIIEYAHEKDSYIPKYPADLFSDSVG